jgi:hypothetical protein
LVDEGSAEVFVFSVNDNLVVSESNTSVDLIVLSLLHLVDD